MNFDTCLPQAILFAVIFSLLPLIYFRWATAAESWREVITCLWRSPVSWVAFIGAFIGAFFVLLLVLLLPVSFVLDWLFTKAPLAAWLLLPVAVMFYLYCRIQQRGSPPRWPYQAFRRSS